MAGAARILPKYYQYDPGATRGLTRLLLQSNFQPAGFRKEYSPQAGALASLVYGGSTVPLQPPGMTVDSPTFDVGQSSASTR